MVSQLATGYEVVGTVSNLADGRVHLLLEGEAEELKAFVAAIEAGPLQSHIRQKEIHWAEATGELKGFRISKGG
jgi:acylphosphatase